MFAIDIERRVACSVERAFYYMCDLGNDPQWWIGVKEVTCTSDTPYRVGATYRQLNALFGIRFPMDIEVTAFEPCRRMDFRSTGQTSAPFIATYIFTPDGDGAVVTMYGQSRADGRAFRLMGPLFRVLLRRFAERNFDRLQRRLEALGAAAGASPSRCEPAYPRGGQA
jgi:hypothetical protein